MTPFTFTTSAGAGTSAALGATSGGVTPWYRLSDRATASSFHLTGTFVASIQPEYSNVVAFDKGNDYAPDDSSFSTPSVRALPLGIGDFVRFRCVAYTSGAPKVSLAKPLGANGNPYTIPEDSSKTPAPSSEGA